MKTKQELVIYVHVFVSASAQGRFPLFLFATLWDR